MGFLSQPGQLGLKTQTAKGTYTDPGAAAPNDGVFLRYTSGSMGGNRELLVPDAEIGGNRDAPDALLGPISYAGEFSGYMRNEFLATVAYGAFGTKATAGSALLGYTHTLTPGDTLPWLSVEEKIGNGYEAFRYTDSKVNTLHLEADASGYVMTTFGMIALTQLAGITTTAAPRTDTSTLFVGTNVTISYNGSNLPAKSFSLDLNNNLEDDDFRLGSLFLGDLVEKRRELTMGCTIRPNDSALWRQAMYGSSSATAPQAGASVKQQVIITITSYEDIPGANAGVKYSTTITVPKATIAPFAVAPSGDDVIEHDLEIRAFRPAAATPLVTMDVKNSYSTVA